MYVCLCKEITDQQIIQAITTGLCQNMKDLCCKLGVATQCGKCGTMAKTLVKAKENNSCRSKPCP